MSLSTNAIIELSGVNPSMRQFQLALPNDQLRYPCIDTHRRCEIENRNLGLRGLPKFLG
jgi:hypothetical protein